MGKTITRDPTERGRASMNRSSVRKQLQSGLLAVSLMLGGALSAAAQTAPAPAPKKDEPVSTVNKCLESCKESCNQKKELDKFKTIEEARNLADKAFISKDSAIETLITEELGINKEELEGSAWEAGITSFILFSSAFV